MKQLSRRKFAKGLAAIPVTLSAASNLLVQAKGVAAQAPVQTPQKAALPLNSDYIFHIDEAAPFAEPLVFTRNPIQPKLQPFALRDVTLGDGPLLEAREWNRAYINRLDAGRLLHNFRVNAGLPSSAKPLGGWEEPKCELRGHFVGHYLSACALLYAATGEQAVKAKGDEIVAGLADCQAKLNDNGYLSAFPAELFDRLDRLERVWAPYYTLHKIMAGLLDMKTLAGNDQALDVLVKLAGWVDAWTAAKTEAHMQEILQNEFGGMNEVLYNLAAVTGDDRWARTGDRFTKRVFFTPLALRRDELKGLHMNTHVPEVIGAARRYELSSDYRFRDVARFFFETVSEARTYATGGSSNNEHWLTEPNHLAAEMRISSHHQECCCSYNMMKLARHLYAWSGDPRLIDYYERNLLNHRLGAIEPTTGLTTYFLSLSPGAWKTLCTEDDSFWCCTGTALEEFAKLNDTIYYHDAESLFVNLYFASTVDWTERGIRVTQKTGFPEADRTSLIVEKTPAAEWALHLRIPVWTTGDNSIAINGRRLEMNGTPGSYLAIRRSWKAGDQIELTLPMRLTAEPLADDTTQQAFLYGPLVLAGQFPRGDIPERFQHEQGPQIQEASAVNVPTLQAKGADPADWIKPVPGQPLTFRTMGQVGGEVGGQARDVTLKPLNRSWERFAVYWTVSS
jgi:hypothetical protein